MATLEELMANMTAAAPEWAKAPADPVDPVDPVDEELAVSGACVFLRSAGDSVVVYEQLVDGGRFLDPAVHGLLRLQLYDADLRSPLNSCAIVPHAELLREAGVSQLLTADDHAPATPVTASVRRMVRSQFEGPLGLKYQFRLRSLGITTGQTWRP